MQMVLHEFLIGVPRAAGIWLALLVPAIAALATVLVRAGRARAEAAETIVDAAPLPPSWAKAPTIAMPKVVRRSKSTKEVTAKPRSEALELQRFAAEVAVAADRSAVIARRRRDEWVEAQAAAERAWEAFQAADSAARRLAATGALPSPHTPRTPAEYVDRERYLRRAAMAACWRRELTILQLSDALAHRAGWDPRRHPVEQEIRLWQAIRDNALAAHRAATARERDAWRAAEDAAEAAWSLRDEAYAAALKSWRVRSGGRVPALAGATARRTHPALGWQAA